MPYTIAAILHFLHFIKCDSQCSSQSSMFTYLPPSSSQSIPITYRQFLSKLRSLLSILGFNPSDYGSHSFRRGGASLAHSAGIPTKHIKALGDWHSDSVFLYLHTSWAFRVSAQRQLISHITSHWHFPLGFPLGLWDSLFTNNTIVHIHCFMWHLYLCIVVTFLCIVFQYHSWDQSHLFLVSFIPFIKWYPN